MVVVVLAVHNLGWGIGDGMWFVIKVGHVGGLLAQQLKAAKRCGNIDGHKLRVRRTQVTF